MDFLHFAARDKGDTLIDLGCGTARASYALSKWLKVYCFDCVDARECDLPFIEGNLWDLFGLPKFDWIFSTDVLEHIPPAEVDKTLDGMAHITRKGGLFSISHLPSPGTDFDDDLTDVELHLTIMPGKWWTEKIVRRWQDVKWHDRGLMNSSVYTFGAPL